MDQNHFRCAYCEQPVFEAELTAVDANFRTLAEDHPETHELILDHLGYNFVLGPAFVHRPRELAYDVLNICKKCFHHAELQVTSPKVGLFGLN